ncbi:hypothetical protein BD410DRAFT_739274 [Rickenella mellea]|uniref:F-box domain-containing protein n=1 Tax=Rickenella mellea TaxID=50990 RepID=A0A4Y7QLZ6_9AGAM|nr:hypothetical protein BD410DRAFT_739274 [Rickenella mellea]
MWSLCNIPTDVQSLLWNHLNAIDLFRLMVTCHAMNSSISNNKQLWVVCARRELTSCQRHLIPYRRSIQDASAFDIQSWFRHSISLDKNYASSAFTVHHLHTEATYAITWLRLIRGRWCLVASSNLNESRLTLWDLSSGSDKPQPFANLFLPGPVMDGQVDDASNTIRVAVTIGSRDLFVRILSVGQLDGQPKINTLRDIPGSAHALLLQGSLVGVTTMDGDDAFPLLAEWTTGKVAVLGPVSLAESASFHVLNKHLPCYAMTSWKEYVVLVMAEEIQVYKRPNFASFGQSHRASLISVHPLDFIQPEFVTSWVAEAHFVEFGTRDQSIFEFNETSHQPPLHIFIRDNRVTLHLFSLVCNTDANHTFTLSRLPCDQLRGGVNTEFMDRIIVGSTGNKVLFRHSAFSPMPRMSIADIQPFISPREYVVDTETESSVIQNHRYISIGHLPQLQFWSSTDFDDARGIFATGNSRGDLCIGRFVEEHILSDTGVVDSLPHAEGLPVEQNCVQMELPVYYEFANAVAEGQLPSALFQDITQSWGLVDGQPFTVPGWSSDWHRFRNIHRWIVPHLRWGGSDIHFSYGGNDSHFNGDEAITTILRHTYNIVGEAHPILYRENDHDTVIFRVGQRYYLYWQRICEESENEIALNVLAFTQSPQNSIGILQSGRLRTLRELQPYYSEPNIASSGQELQINIYDEILHDAIFLGEGETNVACAVINGRIDIQGIKEVTLRGRTFTVD